MPKFKGSLDRTFTVKASKEAVMELMTKANNNKDYLEDLETFEDKGDETYRFVLKEKSEKGINFKGDYTVKYEVSGDKMTWKTVSDGNMVSEGNASFKSLGGDRTEVKYSQTIECDMKVNRLLAKVAKPIVNREIAKGVGGYLDRIKEALEK